MTLDTLKFDERGLIPAIVQDFESGDILMFAWMNRESLQATLKTGMMTYWSRSRQKLWVKGESSGNTQNVREIFVDCDADVLLFKVDPKGTGAACHEGYRSCFFRKLDPSSLSASVVAERVFNPADVYRKK